MSSDFQGVLRSKKLYELATTLIPGGVNSQTRGPVRGVNPDIYPIFMSKAEGSKIWDVDGNKYIDYILAHGPVILGHAHPKVNQAVKKQLNEVALTGFSHEAELEVARKIIDGVPCAESVIFMNSGTEASLLSIKIARSYTGKEKIIKFEGAYHGWVDWLGFIEGIEKPASSGLTQNMLKDVITVPWNNLESLERTVTKHKDETAAIICEPTGGSSGVYLPDKGYLNAMRRITEENNMLLIFDEIKTGFRLAFGGAMEYYGVTPDIAIFAKAIANGFPLSAVAGKKDIMETAKQKILFGGTYNSNPVSIAASLATLNELEKRDVYPRLYRLSEKLFKGINEALSRNGIPGVVQGPGPIFDIFFTELDRIRNIEDAIAAESPPHNKRLDAFRQGLLRRGIFVNPCMVYMISVAHTEEDIEKTLDAVEDTLKEVKGI